jgi:hypothetical protein
VTDIVPADQGDLNARFAALVAELGQLGDLVRGAGPLAAIPATGLVPDVLDGALIETAWGNGIRDRATMRFDSFAQLKAQWPNPADGAVAITLDDGRLYTRRAAHWYWQGWIQPGSPAGTVATDASGIFNLLPATPGVNLDVITGGILELGFAADMTAYAWGVSRYNAGILSARLFKTTASGSGTVAVAVNTTTTVASAFVVGYRN